jgi:hypothetical protein
MYKIPITIFPHFPNFLPRLQKVSSLRFLTTSEAKEGGGGEDAIDRRLRRRRKKEGIFLFPVCQSIIHVSVHSSV